MFFLQINDIISQVDMSGFVPIKGEKANEFFKNFKYSEDQLAPTKEAILETMGIQYFPSDKFVFEKKYEGFKSLPRFKLMLGNNYPILEAKDEEFVGVFDISTYIEKRYEKKPISVRHVSIEQLNEYHFILLRCALFLSKGYKYPKMSNRLKWLSLKKIKRAVHYQPSNYLDNKFNADTIITYKIKLKSGESFREKYKHCEILVFTKTNVGCTAFYCFYTKEGYKKRDEYIREIGQMFRYKEIE
jgi:hypothetical protein